MRKSHMTSIFALLSCTIAFSGNAHANCNWGDEGYVYYWASCTHRDSKVCYDKYPDDFSVLFISKVVFDNGSDDVFKSHEFSDALKIQIGLSRRAKGGVCFESKEKAVADRREFMARSNSDRIVRIYIDEWD